MKIMVIFLLLLVTGCHKEVVDKKLMPNFVGQNVEVVETFGIDNSIEITKEEKYDKTPKGTVISQSVSEGSELTDIKIVVSKGLDYAALEIDELGDVPIMMYHGIHNVTDNKYTGGNVDYDGYQRTADAFRKDLEFYYANGYRMIRLTDYVDGIIDVEAGLSPIIISFDDGLANAIKVEGLDENGEIIIDPNSAVGILESFNNRT